MFGLGTEESVLANCVSGKKDVHTNMFIRYANWKTERGIVCCALRLYVLDELPCKWNVLETLSIYVVQ